MEENNTSALTGGADNKWGMSVSRFNHLSFYFWTFLFAILSSFISSATWAETRHSVDIPSITGGSPLPGILFTPDMNEPRPAVIVLAPGGGIPEDADKKYAQELAKNGYVALTVSYQHNANGQRWSPKVTTDLTGVVNWLRERPDVGGKNIGAVGFSAGSQALLLSTRTPLVRAVVIYYGGYNLRKYAHGGKGVKMPDFLVTPDQAAPNVQASVLLIHGEKDNEISVQDARETYQALKTSGKTVELITYPNAYHRFDRGQVSGRSGEYSPEGFTYRKDPEAAKDAFQRTLTWLETHLSGEPPIVAPQSGDAGEPVGPTGHTPSSAIANSDKNGDGMIEKSEFKGPPIAFDKIDADKNGFLTKHELVDAWKK